LDCSICGNKVAPSANGIIRNVEKVKDSIDGYLERAFKFFKLPVAARGSTSFYAFQPLIAKFNKIDNLAPFVREYYASPSSGEGEEDGETSVIVRKKQSVTALKSKLARIECLRAGELGKSEIPIALGNTSLPDTAEVETGSKGYALPAGALMHLHLTKDVFLNKLLFLSDTMKDVKEVINPYCITCHDIIHEGESIQFSCDCEMLLCRSCAIKQFLSSKNTYRKGLTCPCCHVTSMISFTNVERAKEEELSIIETLIRQYSTAEKKYSSKSIGDLRKLLEYLCSFPTPSLSLSLPSSIKDQLTSEVIHTLSFNQVQLELVRIYVYLERMKPKHGKIILKSIDKKVPKKNKKSGEEDAYFDEEEMKGGKKGKKKKGDKDEVEGGGDIEEVKYYENKEDESYFFENSERDKGFDLPIGPLRLLLFRKDPYVELYLAHTHLPAASTSLRSFREEEENIEEGEGKQLFLDDKHFWEFSDRHRFDQFKPKYNTPCCKCSINPQNMDYIQMHLRTEHSITRRDEIEKFMKQIQITPIVGGEEKKIPFLSSQSADTDVDYTSLASLSHDFASKDVKFCGEFAAMVS
jgi:hypothetical protein